MKKIFNIATKNHKDYFEVEIVIAGITIRFQTDHQTDVDCLNGLLLYHKNTNNIPHEAGKMVHNIVITSSSKQFDLPKDIVPIWEGFVSTEYPIAMVWHNSKVANENFITVGKDILIHHIPESRLTNCYLKEEKNIFGKSQRPILSIYLFLLIHSILSMYGKYSIHSSCVAKNGLAYLFLGKSGAGKTTISTTLGRVGFDYMGDDLTFISRNKSGEIIAEPLLFAAKIVDEKVTKKLKKDNIDVIKDYDFTYSYQQRLGAIFLLQKTPSRNSSILQPVTQGEVYGWLMNSGNNIKMQYNPQLWLDVCEQAATLSSYNMIFGNKEYFNPEILNNVIK